MKPSGAFRLAAAGLAAFALGCGGEYPQSTLHPTADLGGSIDALYRTIFWWAVGVFVVVEAAVLYVIVRYRDRPGAGEPAHLHGSTVLEIAWTLAPVVVLVSIAVPTIRTIFRTDGDAPADAMIVEVVGHQWWWEYRYPELGIVTANEFHVPLGRPVALEMISADVIHSFWAPKLGGKRDVIPGRTTRLFFTPDSVGVFRGQCAEFCGESHANMGLRVVVQDSADFAAWVAVQRTPPLTPESLDATAQRGRELYQQVRDPTTHSCILCHRIEGVSGGTLGPDLTHLASRGTLAAGMFPNDSAGLSLWLEDPPAVKPGSLMPHVELTDDEIAAFVAYLRSLR